jgi:signal transduction histidine kinase
MDRFYRSIRTILVNPHARVTHPENIQRSKLLSTILLVLFIVLAFILVIILQLDPTDIHEPTVRAALILAGIILMMYILNRLGRTSLAALGVVLPLVIIFIYIPFYSGENPIFLAFLMIPIMLTAIFFSIERTTIASVIIIVLVGALLSHVDPSPKNTPYWNLRNMWYFLMLAAGLVLTFMWHISNLEQIRQKELRSINKQLEEKVAELERFAYTVSHELKNPLVTIKGFLGSVEKDMLAGKYDKAQKDLVRISGAADILKNTLTDLLELSRVGSIVNKFEEFPLSEIVHAAVEAQSEKIHSNNIGVNIHPDLPNIYGDRIRLQEVYEILIENAAQYMGTQKSPLIEVGISRERAEPYFFVKDNGIGIEPRYHEKIFGIFEKLNPDSEGTGIGLALTKRIIEVHKGRIWVKSLGAETGTMVCFTIPDPRTQ